MRITSFLVSAALVLAAACSSTGPGADPARSPLSAELVPDGAFECTFDVGRGRTRTFRQERAGEGSVRWTLEEVGLLAEVRRVGESYFFTDGPRRGTELIRLGARPGERWQSDGQDVLFHSWERVEVPAGSYDAARIVASAGPANFSDQVTWWFAEGTGLVQIEYDRAGVDVRRLSRASP